MQSPRDPTPEQIDDPSRTTPPARLEDETAHSTADPGRPTDAPEAPLAGAIPHRPDLEAGTLYSITASLEDSAFTPPPPAPAGLEGPPPPGAARLDPSSAPNSHDPASAPDGRRDPPDSSPYERLALLGRGGTGEVWRVLDRRLRRHVAMKVLRADRLTLAQWERFHQEAQITGQLGHPGITPIYEIGRCDDGRPYFTMKEVRGRSLSQEIEAAAAAVTGGHETRLEVQVRLVRMLVRVCEAVAFAHRSGVLHRDLKPANIMVGEFGEVVVMDWGLARLQSGPEIDEPASITSDASASDVHLTRFGAALGTPGYMAPEQAAGALERIGVHTDVFAIGGLLYACLTGHPPFEAPTVREAVAQALAARPVRPSARPGYAGGYVPRELEAVALRAMAREPADRYPDVESLRVDLDAWLNGRPLATLRYSPQGRALLWMRRHRTAVRTALAALAIALVLGVAGVVKHVRDVNAEAARARAAEATTRLALAEGELATGRALSASGRYGEARPVLRRAIDGLHAAKRPILAAELALWETHHRAAHPVTVLQEAPGTPFTLDDAGRRILLARADAILLRSLPEGGIDGRWPIDPATSRVLDLAFEDVTPVVYLERQGHLVRWALQESASVDPLRGAMRDLGPAGQPGATWRFGPGGAPRIEVPAGVLKHATLHAPGLPPQDLGEAHTYRIDRGRVFTAGYRAPSAVWDAATGRMLRQLCPQICRSFPSPDGSTVALYDEFRLTLRVEALLTGKLRWEIPVKSALYVAWSPDGARLYLAGDQTWIRQIDAATGREIGRLAGHQTALASLATGRDLMASIDTDGRLLVWSEPPRIAGQRYHFFGPDVAVLSADNRLMALCRGTHLELVDLELSESLRQLELPEQPRTLLFIPGQPALWGWVKSGRIRIDLLSGRVDPVDGDEAYDGLLAGPHRLVTTYKDGRLSVTALDGSASSWRRDGVIQGNFWGIDASPDHGLVAVSGFQDRAVVVSDLATGAERYRFHFDAYAYGPALSPDGRAVAVGLYDHTVHVVSMRDGRDTVLKGHRGPVVTVAFTPDGRHLVTGAFDWTVRLWSWPEGSLEHTDELAEGPVGSVRWLDPRRLLTVHTDGAIWVRELDLDRWLQTGMVTVAEDIGRTRGSQPLPGSNTLDGAADGAVDPAIRVPGIADAAPNRDAAAVDPAIRARVLEYAGLYRDAAAVRAAAPGDDEAGLRRVHSLWRAGALEQAGDALRRLRTDGAVSPEYRALLADALSRRLAGADSTGARTAPTDGSAPR